MTCHCKVCDPWYKKKVYYKRLFYFLLGLVIVVAFIVFIIWAVLRPTKPTFTLQEATINQLNATSPTTITTSIQISLLSRNPNDRIAVLYDRLRVYASYHGQQITMSVDVPPTFQGHNDVSLWSPNLDGKSITVAPLVSAAFSQDQTAGILPVDINVYGKLRWKVGTWVSGEYSVYISCPAYVAHDSIKDGAPQQPLRLQQPVGCSTDV